MNGSGLPGGMGSSDDPTGGLAQSWGAQQLNSAQERPDEDKYKKQSVFGSNPGAGLGGGSGDGGGMGFP